MYSSTELIIGVTHQTYTQKLIGGYPGFPESGTQIIYQKKLVLMKQYGFISHSPTVHLDIIKVFYLPTDAQQNCFRKYFNVNLNILLKQLCCASVGK
jgi:hypothetical protein